MIDSIITGISKTLYGVFGYENFKNEIPQDLNPPCFYIRCIEPGVQKFISTRYLRRNHFVIQYFPSTDDRKGESVKKCLNAWKSSRLMTSFCVVLK